MLKEFIRSGALATATPATVATEQAKSAENQASVASVAPVAVATRQSEKTEPAAAITCGNCHHFTRNPNNPESGAGDCRQGLNPARPYPMTPRRCATFTGSGSSPRETINPDWQHDFCGAHADFNHWRGQCPVNLDNCLITRITEGDGTLDSLRGLDIGNGITSDQVIGCWLGSNEPPNGLLKNPCWLVCMAEHFSLHYKKGKGKPSWQNLTKPDN